ncbi:MAG: hypothetical protein EXR27_14775 [Betaproteobacteria bacterium]|nr:hypothetical protein [Betaproteobacteria bacterium]
MNHNPHLKPWRQPQPARVAGKGAIETPGEVANIVWQTRSAEPTEYENQLGDALEAVFESGVATLPDVVAKLNDLGMFAPDGSRWSEDSFQIEIKRLAAK